MPRVDFAPATLDDCREAMRLFTGKEWPIPMRVMAIAARVEGRLLGVGGIAFRPDGYRVAFLDVGDEGRSYPVALHKAALKVIEMAKDAKVRRLIATTTGMHPKSPKWLVHLGFRVEMFDGGMIYVRDL
jgi:hypothetical protein